MVTQSAPTNPAACPLQNHLAKEQSPYLLQHASNKVDWYPWSQEALKKARIENKPILLSIGYGACHWCHVMAHECFENDTIASLQNAGFINIKVDREERPDIDEAYMAATVALNNGNGGWPMTVFLTPDLKPFFAGTYFPPSARDGMPGFDDVLKRLINMWEKEPQKLTQVAASVSQSISEASTMQRGSTTGGVISQTLTQEALSYLRRHFDAQWGGFGPEPKFPPSSQLRFLARMAKEPKATAMLEKTLEAMACGGLYDQLGGGFCRYSVDERWYTPHFEKMLYDNAQLILAYIEGYALTVRSDFMRVAKETLEFMLRELQSPEGAFCSAIDADSSGKEGVFYTFTQEDLSTLTPQECIDCQCEFGLSATGHIVFLPNGLKLSETARTLREKLLAIRSLRPKPLVDEKIIVAWNGLAIEAMAIGGVRFAEPRYIAAASRAADFILSTMRLHSGRLLRSFANKKAHVCAFADDYACLINGLNALYAATGKEEYKTAANALADILMSDFVDPITHSLHYAGPDTEKLPFEVHSTHDGSCPSALASTVRALIGLGRLPLAQSLLQSHSLAVATNPQNYPMLLTCVDELCELQNIDAVGPLLTGSHKNTPLTNVGLGSYRLNLDSIAHRHTVTDALAKGINVFDTASNYGDGHAELLVGQCIREYCSKNPGQREKLFIIGKGGYIQGTTLNMAKEKERLGQPYTEVIKYSDDCWHCISPHFLSGQLTRTRHRLQLATLDTYLLHNPEYLFLHATKTNNLTLASIRDEFYRRITEAFAFLEGEVEKGTVASYGVSSNSLHAPSHAKEAVSLVRLLECAQMAGGTSHHFSSIQLPLNLLEVGATMEKNCHDQSVLEFAAANGIKVFTNRPLNALSNGRLVRLTTVTVPPSTADFAFEIKKLHSCEKEWKMLSQMIKLADVNSEAKPENFFSFAQTLEELYQKPLFLIDYMDFETHKLMPQVQFLITNLDKIFKGDALAQYVSWKSRYISTLQRILSALRRISAQTSADVVDRMSAALAPHTSTSLSEQKLSRQALFFLAQAPGVTTVLCGARSAEHLDDMLYISNAAPPKKDSTLVLNATRSVRI